MRRKSLISLEWVAPALRGLALVAILALGGLSLATFVGMDRTAVAAGD